MNNKNEKKSTNQSSEAAKEPGRKRNSRAAKNGGSSINASKPQGTKTTGIKWSMNAVSTSSHQNYLNNRQIGVRKVWPQINKKNEIPLMRYGHSQLEELLAKHPEDIILSFKDPRFRITNYLNAPTMDSALIRKLTTVLNKAFECNSIQTMVRMQIDDIVQSDYFTRHLYQAIEQNKSSLFRQTIDVELVELAIKLCCRFLYLQPYCQPKLRALKERIELMFVTNKIDSDRLRDMFKMWTKSDEEASKR